MDNGARAMTAQRARLGAFLLALSTSPALAQPPLPAPPTEPAHATAASQPYVLQERVTRARFEVDGRGFQETSLIVKVQNDLGVRHWGQLAFFYTPRSQDLTVPVVEVRKADGQVITPSESAVLDAAIQPNAAAAMFTDIRQKHITLRSLAPGDVVAIRLVWTTHTPIVKGHFWFEHDFERHAIVLDDRLELNLPAGVTPTLRLAPTAPVSSDGEAGALEGDRRIWRWTSSNLAPPPAEPPADEEDEEAPAEIRVSTFKDWADVGGWYHALAAPAAASDAAIRAKAAELTKGLVTDDERIQALYDFVSTRIRYVSLSFGLGRYEPHLASEVLRNEYGDCKDKHTLLAALLEAIGVEAWPVLANNRRKIDPDLPSPSEFDHLITVVPRGKDPAGWVWLDTTPEVAPYGMLFATLRDRDVLVIRSAPAGASAIVRTPAALPFEAFTTLEVEGTINALGVLDGTVRIRVRDDGEVVLRAMLRSLPDEQRLEFVKEFAKGMELGDGATEPKILNLEGTREPLGLEFRLRQRGRLKWSKDTTTLELPLPEIEIRGESSARSSKSSLPVAFGGPSRVTYRASVQLPKGYEAAVPPGIGLDREGYHFSSSYAVKDGRVTAERVVQLRTHQLERDRSAEFLAFIASVRAEHAQAVEVTFDAAAAPEIPDDATAAEVYAAGHAAFVRGEHETALVFFEKTVELDPKHASGWNAIGLTHERLNDLERAVEAHRRHTEVHPFNNRGFKDLGRVLAETRAHDAAVAAYRKHLEIDPLDGESFQALGRLLLNLEEYAAALPVLDRASALLKSDPWVFARLGAARARAGDADAARESFARALSLSDTPDIWAYVAWNLADAGLHPDMAEELAGRALGRGADTFNGLRLQDVDPSHLDLVERVMWSWNAVGWIRFQQGNLDAAQRYIETAWRIGMAAGTADHLGQVFEKRNRMTDAASSYLSALGLSAGRRPLTEQRARKILGEKADIEALVKAAPRANVLEGIARTPIGTKTKGTAEYLVLLTNEGTVADARFESGDEHLRSGARELVGLTLPLTYPDDRIRQMPFRLSMFCTGDGKGCSTRLLSARAAARR